MNGSRESDRVVVPGKLLNKGKGAAACEPAEMTYTDLFSLGVALSHLSGGRFKATVLRRGSERVSFTGPFDLVFTSPPYFDTERYFDEPGQCWRDYPERVQWEEAYLRPTVETARSALRPGGKLVLNVKGEGGQAWREAIGAGVGEDVGLGTAVCVGVTGMAVPFASVVGWGVGEFVGALVGVAGTAVGAMGTAIAVGTSQGASASAMPVSYCTCLMLS